MRIPVLLALLPLAACSWLSGVDDGPAPASVEAVPVHTSPRRWTGIAVAPDGSIFVNWPRWSDDVPVSVARLDPTGDPVPFPDRRWNRWDGNASIAPLRWVCVQSVHCDARGDLWVLDPASPRFAGVVEGGAKLLCFDPLDGALLRAYWFPAEIAPRDSYLNDVRVDREAGFAYLTDSGRGALVVVDLRDGSMRRVLDGHPSTRAEDVVLTIGGREWSRPVHADGIALSPDRDRVYFQALTGRTMYRVPTAALRDFALDDARVAEAVETVGTLGAADGLLFDRAGTLYHSSLEHDAIRTWRPDRGLETLVEGPEIAWPDSFALGPRGDLLFTVSRIHEGEAAGTFPILRVVPPPR